jgi:4-hydroxy-3-methylbut-2-enyl diphosphate reductase
MEVLVAEYAGFCYGVKRALGIVDEALEAGQGPVSSLGPLIHNRQVVDRLKDRGLAEVTAPAEAETGALVIRSHGVGPQAFEEARESGLTILDATCTFVKRAQQAARDFVEQGFETFIVGEADHPEVVAIVAWTDGQARVFDPLQEPPVPKGSKLAVVAQTTQNLATLQQATSYLLNYARELHIANTVCGATTNRQQAAEKLARQVDVLVVVGGYHSANTRRLAQIGSEITTTHHVETAEEVKPSWFEGAGRVGVTAGASTSQEILDEVVQRIVALGKQLEQE